MLDQLEPLAKRGALDAWYLIARSDQVGSRPVGLKRLNTDLVLWRDSRGVVHVQEDRCPHRGARLSQGDVHEDLIICPYHGVNIDSVGCVAAVPAFPSSPMVGKPAVRTYPSQEHNMGIWAWFGKDAAAKPNTLVLPEEFGERGWNGYLWTGRWNCNWLFVLDNIADPMHGSYLHSDTYTLGHGGKADRMRLVNLPDGFRVEREGQQGLNFDAAEFHNTGYLWVRIDVPYPRSAGPGGPLRIIGTVTPIDETASQVFFAHFRQSSGWQNDAWRLLYRTVLYPRHMKVLAQDQMVLEGLPQDARTRERLYQHDIGVTRLRRLLLAEAGQAAA